MSIPSLEELNILHSHICQAFAEPKRIQILYVLYDEPRNVNALAEALNAPQSTISRHLAILRQSLLIEAERSGTSTIYRLSDPRIITLLDGMRGLVREAIDRRASAYEPEMITD